MVAAAGLNNPVPDRMESLMKILRAAMLAGTLLAGTAHADTAQDDKLAIGLICKNARDLRNFVRSHVWTLPEPDHSLAVRQANAAAHDPMACEFDAQLYEGEPEPVTRIVRRPGEVYLVVRFTPLDATGHRYILLPGR